MKTVDGKGKWFTLRAILKVMAFHRGRYAASAAGWMIFHLWPLLPGVLGKALFDTLEGGTEAGLNVTTIVAITVAAGLARMASIFGATVAVAGWHVRTRGLVQRNLLARLFERPGARAMPGSVGAGISTLRDDSEAISQMGDWGFDALSAVIFASTGLAILISVDARVTVLVMVPIICVIALAQLARARAHRLRERSRAATAQVTGTIGEIVVAVRAIQAAGTQDSVVAHLARQGDERRHAMVRDKTQSYALDAIFNSTASLGAGLVLLTASGAMRSGDFTIGDFVLFATYLMQVASYTGFIGYLVRTFQQVRVSLDRSVELMQGAPPMDVVRHHPLYLKSDAPIDVQPRSAEPLEMLDATGLAYRFPGSDRGISDVSLQVRRGSVTVIAGPMGAGKTTTVRALLGLLDRQGGEIRWNGRHVADPGDFLVPPRVAYTAQTPTLLSGTLRENILLGLPDDGRVDDAVRRAVLGPDVAGMPDGVDTEIGVRGVRLSGGQIQRTAAARMFARNPELLVMDDLSSALDVETERELWRMVFSAGVTSLVVSHRRAVLERADQIVLFDSGTVVARGTLAELLDTSSHMRRLYGVQTARPR
jgi:ATP-binding cassette subfamily B protein